MKVKIIVSHRIGVEADTVDNPIYLNVRAGAVTRQDFSDTMQGDNTGENISDRVCSLCEYTPLYWAWKNLDADYIGLCHYRRYLSFSDKDLKHKGYLKLGEINNLSRANQHLLRIDDENYMKSVISRYDMIVPYEYDSSKDWLGDKSMTLREQWIHINKNFLTDHDFDVLLELIRKHSPEYYEPMIRFMNGHKFRGFNCFVMKRELFNEFCEFVFPILIDFDDLLNKDELSEYQMRAPGFAGEWLFSMWTQLKEKDKNVKTLQTQLVTVDDANRQEPILPRFGLEIPPFVFIETEDNIQRIAVSIESLISNKQARDRLDIIILQKSLDIDSWEWHSRDESNRLLMEMVEGRRDISMRFYNPKNDIGKLNVTKLLKGLDEEEYYPALLPWILSGFEKAVFISENAFFKKSPVEWYQKLIEEKFSGFGVSRNFIKNQNRDNIYEPESDLFVCNLKDIREKYNRSDVIDMLISKNEVKEKSFISYCYKNDLTFIDDNGIFRDEFALNHIKNGIPAKYYKKIPSYEDAYILKVPDAENIDMSHGTRIEKYYWRMALRTVFYNDLLSDWMDRRYDRSWISRNFRKAVNVSPMDARTDEQIFADKLFPHGSTRRDLIEKIVPKGSDQWNGIKDKTKKLLM